MQSLMKTFRTQPLHWSRPCLHSKVKHCVNCKKCWTHFTSVANGHHTGTKCVIVSCFETSTHFGLSCTFSKELQTSLAQNLFCRRKKSFKDDLALFNSAIYTIQPECRLKQSFYQSIYDSQDIIWFHVINFRLPTIKALHCNTLLARFIYILVPYSLFCWLFVSDFCCIIAISLGVEQAGHCSENFFIRDQCWEEPGIWKEVESAFLHAW